MLNVIIIDDEPSALKTLEWELQNFCKNVTVLKTFLHAKEAILFLETSVVDCVFLDIEMPEIDGFQFLDKIQNKNFLVVFTTAYGEYAIKAIKEKAFDYLLKPIDTDDLQKCIEKLQLLKNEKTTHELLEQNLEKLIQQNQFQTKKISFTCDGKLIFLNPNDVVYCESDGNYCRIYLENKEKYFITQKLKFMEEKLDSHNFFRIHNSYLINLNKVLEFHKGEDYVLLSNRVKLPVSRNKKSNFLEQL